VTWSDKNTYVGHNRINDIRNPTYICRIMSCFHRSSHKQTIQLQNTKKQIITKNTHNKQTTLQNYTMIQKHHLTNTHIVVQRMQEGLCSEC